MELEEIYCPHSLELRALCAGKTTPDQQRDYEENNYSFTFIEGTKMPI
jgi:hypothetical protein